MNAIAVLIAIAVLSAVLNVIVVLSAMFPVLHFEIKVPRTTAGSHYAFPLVDAHNMDFVLNNIHHDRVKPGRQALRQALQKGQQQRPPSTNQGKRPVMSNYKQRADIGRHEALRVASPTPASITEGPKNGYVRPPLIALQDDTASDIKFQENKAPPNELQFASALQTAVRVGHRFTLAVKRGRGGGEGALVVTRQRLPIIVVVISIPDQQQAGHAENICAALNNEVLRADQSGMRREWSGVGLTGRGKRVIPEKTRRPAESSATTPACENPLLASDLGEPGSIPEQVTSGFSYVGIVPDDAAGRRVFSRSPVSSHPFIPALLHTHLTSPTSALKTSLLRAAQISRKRPTEIERGLKRERERERERESKCGSRDWGVGDG
ncbi:hypothetical protein PR048_006100 [Dryococelus australis]|uniref:Uncharacterized protein n=1 Tax=Dryococelus australis TaxID=614101 RepID=A0ABQ9IA18_9NEOP|nr:hypothetical protein PR048_006100 [Dryococelus australis]